MVTENKPLKIVKTLKARQIILLSQKLKIYTDHKNVTCILKN